ncbi:Protein adenylyltransferase SelO [Gammaproteobacteria bacterium]
MPNLDQTCLLIRQGIGWRFDNSYIRLPNRFFSLIAPTPVTAPQIVLLNYALAEALGLDPHKLSKAEAAALFSGNILPDGAEPLAQAYAGHQYGHLTMLGDGRAILLGEHVTPAGQRVDIQLKGSGPTPFSRRGDGRAALGPMLREYIISEAMQALGIPTTRSLAVVTTGERVIRESLLPGAVLTRVAASHIRIGTFEYFAMRGDWDGLQALVTYTLRRHDSDLDPEDKPALMLLNRVVERQAALISQWMLVGFIHGVMNTDNISIVGETIDYGPCAFMDNYDPSTVFSSIDHSGRYAYGNQPKIAHWNLARFAEALLPLLSTNESQAITYAESALDRYPALYQAAWLDGMRKKLGLYNQESEDDALINSLLDWMRQHKADYTNTFRALASVVPPMSEIYEDRAFNEWCADWHARRSHQQISDDSCRALMRASNPDIIPRNHQVERALVTAAQGDFAAVNRLVAALANPYDEIPEHLEYRSPPSQQERVSETFCGT